MSKKLDSVLDKLAKANKVTIVDPAEANSQIRMSLDSPGLNFALGGGWVHGRIYYLQGPESGGKSTLATYIASQIQKHYAGHNTTVYLDYEYSADVSHMKDLGLDVDKNFILLRPLNGEDGFDAIRELVETDEVGLVIIDSITSMSSRAQTEDFWKATFGGQANLLSTGLRAISSYLYKHNCSLILISQERQSMCIDKNTSVSWKKSGVEIISSIKDMFKEGFNLNSDEMEIGKAYPVNNLNIEILSYDGNQSSFKKILHAIKKEKTSMYKIEFNDGSILRTSGDHKIAVNNNDLLSWESVKDLYKKKDHFDFEAISDQGKTSIISIEKDGEDYPLDIEVEDTHSYYSNRILSHNSLYGADFKGTGGYAPKYYASWMARITRIEDITDKDKGLIGIKMRVRNTKNKLGIPKRDANLTLYFDGGIDSDDEYLDYLKLLGIIEQRGAWFYNEEWGMKVAGKNGVAEFLHNNPELYEKVKAQVNDMICGHTILDNEEQSEEDAFNDYSEDYIEENNDPS